MDRELLNIHPEASISLRFSVVRSLTSLVFYRSIFYILTNTSFYNKNWISHQTSHIWILLLLVVWRIKCLSIHLQEWLRQIVTVLSECIQCTIITQSVSRAQSKTMFKVYGFELTNSSTSQGMCSAALIRAPTVKLKTKKPIVDYL